MSRIITHLLVTWVVVAAATLCAATAQDVKPYKPVVGQEGKDVIWVPSAQALVDRMLDMAKLTVDDYVVDLGSGDGRTVITAARRGARALGIEYNPELVALSRTNATAAGVDERATFVQGDIFNSDFSTATIVTLFLLEELNLRLRPLLLDMKPNTRVVSNTFDMGDWTPDDRVVAGTGCNAYCHAYYWIVPAKVAGTWRLPEGELVLEQTFQMLTGTLKSPGGTTAITNGKMRGDQITFMIGDKIYNGRVAGDRMEGVFMTEARWEALRR